MSRIQPVLTERLDLRCSDPRDDLEDLFVIFSDPDGWWYDPAGRHVEREQTRGWLSRAASRFDAEHNLPSRRVAERLGLTNYGLAVDPSDDQPRLAYADRPIGTFSDQPH